MNLSILNISAIIFGGALGSLSRYILSEFVTNFIKFNYINLSRFPWGTFLVNVLGSLIAGFIYFLIIRNFDNFNFHLKNFLLTGFLGGFTTFSALSLDFLRLSVSGNYLQAFSYIFLSLFLSILAVFFGFYLAKIIF